MKKHTKKVVFLLKLIIFISISLDGQRLPSPDILTVEDGLSFREVTNIVQDKDGLMWFGTTNGLNYFDGYQFDNFFEDLSKNLPFKAANFLRNAMHFKNDSTLWTIVENKLFALHLKSFKIEAINGIPDKIWFLQKGKKGTFWLVSENEEEQFLWYYKDKSGFEKIASVPRIRREFTDLKIDTMGNAWWATNSKGIQQYNTQGDLLHEVKLDSFIWYGTKMYFTPMFIDLKNQLHVFPKSQNELWKYNPDNQIIETIIDNLPTPVYHGLEDRQGNKWFALRDGVFQINSKGEFINYSTTLKQKLDFTSINSLFEDHTSVLWIGTNGGLIKFPLRKGLFNNHLTKAGVNWGNAMRGITGDDKGNLYFYCENGDIGLHQLDLQTGNIQNISNQSGYTSVLENAMDLVFDKERSRIWTVNNNLIKIDPFNNSIEKLYPIPHSNKSNSFHAIGQFPNSNLVIGDNLNSISIFNPESDTFRSIQLKNYESDEASPIKAFLPISNEAFWVGTKELGVFLINTSGTILKHFSSSTQPSLVKDHILCLHIGENKEWLWVGTFGGGLYGIHLSTDRVINFSNDDGLTNNNIVSILEDSTHLWLGTYNGLSNFHKKEHTFQNFYEEDGLSNNEFNYTSFYKSQDGQMHIGGMNGVNSYYPKNLLKREQNLPLLWTSFTKYDHQVDSTFEINQINSTLSPIQISPQISYFQFEWTLPNYSKSDKNQFYSLLEGFDEDWIYLGNSNSIRFNQLPAGNYNLRIKGKDSKGNWSSEELNMSLQIQEVLYKRPWFIILSMSILMGLVYLISRIRYQRKLEMEKIRTKIASDLHDEVGSMLSGLAMQAEILEIQSQTKDKKTLQYLSHISRQAVSKMRDMVWSIDSRKDRVYDLLDRMREHAEEMFSPLEIDYQLKEQLPINQKLPVDTRQNLYLIFKEAVTNICKHSNASHVDIYIGNNNGKFEMSIKDNGCSQNGKLPSSGLGLSNMKMRAEALKAEFIMSQNNGFEVCIQMKTLK